MHGIFINYRRDDAAGFARSLYENLVQEFSERQVFMDVEALREPGIDFTKEIERSLGRCAVMLVLIGKGWLASTGPDGRRRLDDPGDFVRLEIATALRRDVRVIPVLLNNAPMPPSEELPEDLQLLGRRQAIGIQHDDWTHDVSRLVEALAKIPGLRRKSARRAGWSTRSLMLAGSAGAALGLGLLVWIGYQVEESGPEVTPSGLFRPVPGDQPVDGGTASGPPPADSRAAPEESASGPPAPSAGDVRRVQILLASLGYDPGVVDGVYGAATVTAIRAFQADEGYAVTGSIDAGLIAQLQQISQDRSARDAGSAAAGVEEAAFQPDADPGYEEGHAGGYAAAAGAGADISGTWYDNNGLAAQIVQQGSSLTVGAINPATGLLQIIGSGRVQGDVVTIEYQNFAGVPGLVQAQLAPDGRHMNGTDTNALLSIPVPNTWHREHLPGN